MKDKGSECSLPFFMLKKSSKNLRSQITSHIFAVK